MKHKSDLRNLMHRSLESSWKLGFLGVIYHPLCYQASPKFKSPIGKLNHIIRLSLPHVGRIVVAWISGSFIYAFNDSDRRLELWRDLKKLNTQLPWVLCGDLNCVMVVEERIYAIVRQVEIEDINDCMNVCWMSDVKSIGNCI